MASNKQEYEKYYFFMLITAYVILLLNIYYYCHPIFEAAGLSHPVARSVLKQFRDGGLFSSPNRTKSIVYLLMVFTHAVRSGKGKKISWTPVIAALLAGGVLFFVAPHGYAVYLLTTAVGFGTSSWAVAMISRNLHGFKEADNDINETFEQCDELMDTPDSVNIPTKYQYRKKIRRGWINVVNPFRATMILGTPGSGKSFSVYNPFIEQMIDKGYCMFVYDYKFPDLTEIVYNETLRKYPLVRNPAHALDPSEPEWVRAPQSPEFLVINFKDPRYSNRCNPIHPRYIEDPADSAEIADIVMKNVAPGTVEKEDFFSMSAKVYLDAIIYFLSIYQNGRYCTFPHVIELMSIDYKKVFSILAGYDELETKIKPFASALEAGAQDQLQGQIASATIPLNKMASPALYWVLSGDDFSLDMNNPDEPKIICVGNDPDRQAIYGTTLALFTSRMFKLINHKGKRKCGVLLDELPTIFIKGLDNLIATARSNKVAIVLGAQDKSQLVRDYSQKEADVIFNTVGNILAGQVNGKTAEDLNKTFGREFREQQSQTRNIDSESVSVSFHQEELMPVSKIETLTQGYFFGKVADNNDTRIEKKLFCGEIQIDLDRWRKKMKTNQKLPVMTLFNDDEIRARVREELLSKDIIRTWCVRKIIEEDGAVYDDEEMERRIGALEKSLGRRERDEILDAEAEIMIQETVERTVRENFERIREDVRRLVEDELPGDYGDDDDEKNPLDEIEEF